MGRWGRVAIGLVAYTLLVAVSETPGEVRQLFKAAKHGGDGSCEGRRSESLQNFTKPPLRR